jgi:acyl transferase domain-containing protein/phosphopantetheinyl transferase
MTDGAEKGRIDEGGREDIAIVGMAGIFPRADTIADFWQNIVDGVDCVDDPPPSWRSSWYALGDRSASMPVYVDRGAYLGDRCRFNPAKYGVMPASVDGSEPDQFLALRCAHEAMEDAGIPGLPLNREKTAVIIGRGSFVNRGILNWISHGFVFDQLIDLLEGLGLVQGANDLAAVRDDLKRQLPQFQTETAAGVTPCIMVGRIANRLDLKGPTYTLDAACSSTLIAAEHGMREILAGRCDAALVGGVQVTTASLIHQLFCRIEGLSKSGVIAPLSAEAQGTLLGEGCGMLLLKRRSDAERDGHRIYALLKSVGVSCDGRGAGLLAPRTEGQQLAIRRAFERSGLPPSSIGLIEAHATGIPLGDKTEVGSLAACFGGRQGKYPTIGLGSVKSMIGHLLPASGAASLIKTALALYHRTLPPTLHAERPNPELDLERTPFYLSTRVRPWIQGDLETPRRAGVNAFGFGGINAHTILEEFRGADESRLERLESRWPAELVVVSAPDRDRLVRRIDDLVSWLAEAEGVRLLDVAASCAAKVEDCRLAVIAADLDELGKKLAHARKLLDKDDRRSIQDRSGIFWYESPLARPGRVAFVFSGAGAQYPNMLADLCRHFPEARRQFDLADAAYRRMGREPLSRLVFPLPEEDSAAAAELLEFQPAMTSVMAAERALLAVLGRLGLRADAVVGHSNGEFVALQAAGAYRPATDDELIESIVAGAELAARAASPGLLPDIELTAIEGADPEAVGDAVRESSGRLVVAIDNCPHQVVLAGDPNATAAAKERLRGKGGLYQRLPIRALHTEGFGPACDVTAEIFRTVRLEPPLAELWSCTRAGLYPTEPEAMQDLVVRQLSCKVRFRETIEAMYEAGIRVFVEVGPRGILSGFVSGTLGKRPHAAVPLDRMRLSSVEQLCRAVGMLVAHGVHVDLPAFFGPRRPRILDLEAAPPRPPAPDPILDQSLPELKFSEAIMERLRGARRPGPSTPPAEPAVRPAPATAPTPPVAAALAASPLEDRGPAVLPAVAEVPRLVEVSVDPMPAGPPPDFGPPAVPAAPVVPAMIAAPGDVRVRAMAEYQRTMRAFVDAQERVTQARFRSGAGRRLTEPVGGPARAIPATGGNGHPHADARPSAAPAALPNHRATAEHHRPAPALLDRIVQREGDRRLIAESTLDVARHRFLLDHPFFGRNLSVADPDLHPLAVMPLAMTLEIMAEAAVLLRPGDTVVALRDVQTRGWLAFESDTRRVRVEAIGDGASAVRVVVSDAAPEAETAVIAEGVVELAAGPRDPGRPTVPDAAATPFPFPAHAGHYGHSQEEVYGCLLFHGPAFQTIASLDACDRNAVRATVRRIDLAPYLPEGRGHGLVLPVDLIDASGQIATCAILPDWTEDEVHLTFPNRLDRVEFAPRAGDPGPLRAVARVAPEPTRVGSDLEMTTRDGRVILRVLGRSEQLVRLPGDFYRYWSSPRRVSMSRELGGLFRDVPAAEGCTICELGRLNGKLWVNRLWAQSLARMILGARERRAFASSALPPVAAVSWLNGRIVAKDAARLHLSLDGCMADVEVLTSEHGRPRVMIGGADGPLISLAHKGLDTAVAVAGDAGRFAGVGIDVEALGPVGLEVETDAFTPVERRLIEAAAKATGEPIDHWRLSVWGAKEAVGKALGRGVLGGPQQIEATAIDPSMGRMAMALRGVMAAAFPGYAAISGRITTIDAYRRLHGKNVITLCLLPRKA